MRRVLGVVLVVILGWAGGASAQSLRGTNAGGTVYGLAVPGVGSLTVDLSFQGRGGRDQAGNLTTFAHLYLTTISGASPALRASASTTGSTLANSETDTGYLTTIRLGSANTPVTQYVLGATTCPRQRGEPGIHAGTSITWLDMSGLVPPNALSYTLEGSVLFKTSSSGNIEGNLELYLGSATTEDINGGRRHTAPVSIFMEGLLGSSYVKESHAPILMPVVAGETAVGFYSNLSLNQGGSDSVTGYYPHPTCWVND